MSYHNSNLLHIQAKYKDQKQPVTFYIFVHKDEFKKLSEDQAKTSLNEELKKVSIHPVSAINRSILSYSHVNRGDLAEFNYGNVLIEVHLPYCLHIPTGYKMEIFNRENNLKSLVIFEKIWTNRAKEDGKPSDQIDFFAENQTTYFQKSTILTPKYPVRPEEGWDQYFTGRNIEKIKDQNGTFRYTRLYIQFNTKQEPKDNDSLNESGMHSILKEISDLSLAIVNQIIDCYRYISKEEYVERLGTLSINSIYFLKVNRGFYMISSGFGIESAQMNRPTKELDAMEKTLFMGESPPLHQLLILDSHSALDRKSFTLAIVESFQALEIFLENYLIAGFEKIGISKKEYEKKMDQFWKTKDRLKTLLKEISSKSLQESSAELWNQWCTIYDKVRNEVIHQGKPASFEETKKTMETNEAIINHLQKNV